MKDESTKQEFIRLRAEGMSYRRIAEALHISKDTCRAWDAAFMAEVKAQKNERLEELYSNYAISKEARITRLGETLKRIKTALDVADLEAMPPEKLLDYYLKYSAALREEYTPATMPTTPATQATEQSILQSLQSLLERTQAGEVSTEQATREQSILASLLKAYDIIEIKKKLEMLENLIESK